MYDNSEPFQYWWEHENEDDICKAIWDLYEGFRHQRQARLGYWAELLSLYYQRTVSISDLYRMDLLQKFTDQQRGQNPTAISLETLWALVSSAEPRPVWETDGAELTLQRQAQDQSEATLGVLYENGGYELGADILKDAMIFGTGFCKLWGEISRQDKTAVRLRAKPRKPWDILVDPVDAAEGEPCTMIELSFVDRAKLRGRHPKDRAIIDECASAGEFEPAFASEIRAVDRVPVLEAIYLGEEGGAGLRVVCCQKGVLEKEPWDRDTFPIWGLHWIKPEIGFYGRGIVEIAGSVQERLNAIQARIDKVFARAPMPVIATQAVEGQDQIAKMRPSGVVAIPYKNQPPTKIVDGVIHPQMLQREADYARMIFERTGANQAILNGTIPPGMEAGVAIRNYKKLTSERHMPQGKYYDGFFIEFAKQCAEEARRWERKGYEVVTEFVV